MEEAIHNKMEELRMICEREIPIQQQRANNARLTFGNSLQSIKLTSQQAPQEQVKLGQLKAHLREVEDDLVKALAVKTRKEAKHIIISESISASKAEIEELKKSLHDQKARQAEYSAIMSHQLLDLATLEEKANQGIKDKEDIQEIISWYNKILGLRIEGGRAGIKVIFNNINPENPSEEYCFTVQFVHDIYTLLNCDPQLEGTKQLIQELNQTNGFFKFVRIMRGKFQEAASIGFRPHSTSGQLYSSTVSASAPASSVSLDGNEFLGEENTLQVQTKEGSRTPKKVSHGRKGRTTKSVGRSPGRSPESASSIRRSSRLKVSYQEASPGSVGGSSGSASSTRHSSRLKVSN